MSAWLEDSADPAKTLVLDWQAAPFAVKQGITTRESIQLICGLYRFRKSMPKMALFYKPSSICKRVCATTWQSPPSTEKINCNSTISWHNTWFPFATVSVNTVPCDGFISIDFTTLGCTKLCIVPLSNIHSTYAPRYSATSYSRLGHKSDARSEIQATIGETFTPWAGNN